MSQVAAPGLGLAVGIGTRLRPNIEGRFGPEGSAVVGLFVITLVATPLVFAGWLVQRVFAHRLKLLEMQAQARRALPPAQVPSEIEARIRNLEDIVCSLDFDLQTKLRQSDGTHRGAA